MKLALLIILTILLLTWSLNRNEDLITSLDKIEINGYAGEIILDSMGVDEKLQTSNQTDTITIIHLLRAKAYKINDTLTVICRNHDIFPQYPSKKQLDNWSQNSKMFFYFNRMKLIYFKEIQTDSNWKKQGKLHESINTYTVVDQEVLVKKNQKRYFSDFSNLNVSDKWYGEQMFIIGKSLKKLVTTTRISN